MNISNKEFFSKLEIGESQYVFGICYSILKYSGIFSSLSWKIIPKLIENGHATTFFYDVLAKKATWTGISDDGWEFTEQRLYDACARDTVHARTYVYYIYANDDLKRKYTAAKTKFKKTKTTYAAFWPNFPLVKTHYENCVSHSQHLVHELGLGYFINRGKGWWIPSIANWMDWFSLFIPFTRKWKYKVLDNVNTYVP